MDKKRTEKVVMGSYIGHGLGIASGIAFSIWKKTGFWKGLGYTILFGMMGAGTGAGLGYLTSKDANTDQKLIDALDAEAKANEDAENAELDNSL